MKLLWGKVVMSWAHTGYCNWVKPESSTCFGYPKKYNLVNFMRSECIFWKAKSLGPASIANESISYISKIAKTLDSLKIWCWGTNIERVSCRKYINTNCPRRVGSKPNIYKTFLCHNVTHAKFITFFFLNQFLFSYV